MWSRLRAIARRLSNGREPHVPSGGGAEAATSPSAGSRARGVPTDVVPERRSSAWRRVFDLASVALFLALLGLPHVDHFVRPAHARAPTRERRPPHLWPAAPTNVVALASDPRELERAFGDRLGLRDVLLRWNSCVRWFVFATSPTPICYPGENGWINYTGDALVPVLRGLRPFTRAELDAWQARLESRRDFAAAWGGRYLFVVAPDKETIYPECVPERFNRVGPTRLEQFVEHMRTHSTVEVVDLRDALRAERANDTADDFTYVQLGSHWTGRGIYAAYREIVRRLQRWHPQLMPLEIEDLEAERTLGDGDSLATQMYVGDLFTQRDWYYRRKVEMGWRQVSSAVVDGIQHVETAVDDPSLPTALVLHDSYGTGPSWLLQEHFSSCKSIDWPVLDADDALSRRYEVVLEIYVERALFGQNPRLGALPLAPDLKESSTRGSALLFALDPDSSTGGLRLHGSSKLARDPNHPDRFTFEVGSGAGAAVAPDVEVLGSGVLWASVRGPVEQAAGFIVLVQRKRDGKYEPPTRSLLVRERGRSLASIALRVGPGPVRVALRLASPGVEVAVDAFELRTDP